MLMLHSILKYKNSQHIRAKIARNYSSILQMSKQRQRLVEEWTNSRELVGPDVCPVTDPLYSPWVSK